MTIILEALEQNKVSIKSKTLEVIVVDAHTAKRAENQRLPSSTLVSILSNILNCTKIPYSVKGITQVWEYSGVKNEDRRLLIESYENSPEVGVTLEDDENQTDHIELLIEQGTSDDLEAIFARLEDNAFAIQEIELVPNILTVPGSALHEVTYFGQIFRIPTILKAFTLATDRNGEIYIFYIDMQIDGNLKFWKNINDGCDYVKLATCKYAGDWKESKTDYLLK